AALHHTHRIGDDSGAAHGNTDDLDRPLAMRAALIVLFAGVACASPEATRERGGGPGADVGNRDVIVEIHQGAEPYHATPCRMTDVGCPDPVLPCGAEPRRES